LLFSKHDVLFDQLSRFEQIAYQVAPWLLFLALEPMPSSNPFYFCWNPNTWVPAYNMPG